jgi:hypothetical protein
MYYPFWPLVLPLECIHVILEGEKKVKALAEVQAPQLSVTSFSSDSLRDNSNFQSRIFHNTIFSFCSFNFTSLVKLPSSTSLHLKYLEEFGQC